MSVSIPMPTGLAAFLQMEGPDMWHEFALGLDFADPKGTIDLLIAADRITRHPDCDRATAALLLAKAAIAGFHRGDCPPGFDAGAARAFAVRLTDALVTGAFAKAQLALPPEALRMVRAELGPRGPLPLPPLAFGTRPHQARYDFAGWRPVSTASSRARAA
jgi:hypothetical protein